MLSCGPVSASTAAAWLMLLVLEVDWLCSLSIALVSATLRPVWRESTLPVAVVNEAYAKRHFPAGALDRREPWGVWGGQLLIAGVVVARKRPRGRPRKHPLPETYPGKEAAA